MSIDEINGLNKEYTFKKFVVGNSNRFAYQVALAVAEAPGESYNPLFIYGKNGIGKTHLMHAIGNKILRNNKKVKVLYVRAEDFANELTTTMKKEEIEEIYNKYKKIDLLLVDNIQFLAGEEKSQKELLHIFNILYENRKQIVICSDVEPKYISDISDNIKKYEWGIIADIDVPEYETRLAILRKKAKLESIIIDDEILSNIANRIDTNIRELEGALNKLIAKSSLINSPITMEMAEWAINDIIEVRNEKNNITNIEKEIYHLINVISKYFNVDEKYITERMSKDKMNDNIWKARQITRYLFYKLYRKKIPHLFFEEASKIFKMDMALFLHWVHDYELYIENQPEIKKHIENIKKILEEEQKNGQI